MKKSIALLLAVVLMLGCLSGCGSISKSKDSVMSVEGYEVGFDDFMYYLGVSANNLLRYYQVSKPADIEWDATCTFDKSKTNAEWCVSEALFAAAQGCMIRKKAAELDVSISSEQKQKLKDDMEKYKESFKESDDPEAEFEKYLNQNNLTSQSLTLINEITCELQNLFDKLYGPNGEELADDVFNDFVEKNGYMTSAHILFRSSVTTTDKDGKAVTEKRSDSEKAAGKAKLEGFVKELRAISDNEERKARFLELMQAESEDPGKTANPNGYCFTQGVMVQEFTDATMALKDYEISDVVESSHGYHVIMRLPTVKTDIDAQSNESLGITAASNAFYKSIEEWDIASHAKFNSGYSASDFTKLFGDNGFEFTTAENFKK